jgi:hypothetical protein
LYNSYQRLAIAGHGCFSKDDISKEDSDQARQWSYFLRVYSPGAMAEYTVTSQKGHIKPLKIRPSAIRPIDIVLRGSAVTEFL